MGEGVWERRRQRGNGGGPKILSGLIGPWKHFLVFTLSEMKIYFFKKCHHLI